MKSLVNYISNNLWTVIILATVPLSLLIIIMIPSERSTQRLEAYLPETNIFGLVITYTDEGVKYSNESSDLWTNCNFFMINNKFISAPKHDIESREKLFLSYNEFADSDGVKFIDSREDPRQFKLSCYVNDEFRYDEFVSD